jgi:hypothetical protein
MGILLHFYKISAKGLGLFPPKPQTHFWDLDVVGATESLDIRSIHEKGETYNVFKVKSSFFCHTNGGLPRSS